MLKPIKVMIAGVGGASLGTEISKSLSLVGGYEIYGCDISATAYGLYDEGFSRTWLISRDEYVTNVLNACKQSGARFLIPGGEQPMSLLGSASKIIKNAGIHLLANSSEVIELFSNKEKTFECLVKCGISVPKTIAIRSIADFEHVGLPCIVKPSTGSGGSAGVFFAVSVDEAMIYAEFISRTGIQPVAQEYIGDDDGEFTIGVLSLQNGAVVGSIAMRRVLDAKLSVAYRGRGGVISSGYSQGYIGEFDNLCRQAENIALAIGSCGPINIQGRVRDGVLLPFEINPRFSASTYLRAMAGFNEVDILIQYVLNGVIPETLSIKTGWYLRSLTEKYVNDKSIK